MDTFTYLQDRVVGGGEDPEVVRGHCDGGEGLAVHLVVTDPPHPRHVLPPLPRRPAQPRLGLDHRHSRRRRWGHTVDRITITIRSNPVFHLNQYTTQVLISEHIPMPCRDRRRRFGGRRGGGWARGVPGRGGGDGVEDVLLLNL